MARRSKAVSVELVEVVEAGSVEAQEIHDVVVQELKEAVATNSSSLLTTALAQITKSETEVVVKADKNEGVGQFIRKLIGEGLGNKAILDIVHEQYGNKNTTYACVAWYRNKMKKAGVVQQVVTNLDWLQNFAKANGLSEESTEELGKALKVA